MAIDLRSRFQSTSVPQALELVDNLPAGLGWHDESRRGPLAIAAMLDRVDLIEAFVAQGADLEATDLDGRTPLLLACVRNNIEAIQALDRLGANLFAKDNEGYTALLLCLVSRSAQASYRTQAQKCLQFFMDKGLDPFASATSEELGVLDYVSNEDYWIVSTIVKQQGLEFFQKIPAKSVFRQVYLANFRMLARLLEDGVPAHYRDDHGATLPMALLSSNYPITPKMLSKLLGLCVSQGADLLAKDNEGNTLADIVASPDVSGNLRKITNRFIEHARIIQRRADLLDCVVGDHSTTVKVTKL